MTVDGIQEDDELRLAHRDAALKYVSMGIPVIRLKPGEKVPNSTFGLHDATDDYDKAGNAWFRHPYDNIGLVVGGDSRIVVIDIDTKGAVDGFDTLHDWEAEHGELPETASVKTQSGGQHLYYRLPENVSIRTKCNAGKGIDIKCDGGYVVAPPSVCALGRYEWEEDLLDVPIADADESVLDFIDSVCERQMRVRKGEQRDASEWVRFEMPAVVHQGEREDMLFRLACSLQAKGKSDAEIELAVRDAAIENCVPPAEESDIRSALYSALQYEKGGSREGEKSLYDRYHDYSKDDYEVPSETAGKATEKPYEPLMLQRPIYEPLPKIERLDATSEVHLAPELIHGLIRRGGKGIIVAGSKAGKTWLVMELAVAVALGDTWLGFRCEQGKVLYVNFELQKESARSRFIGIIGRLGLSAEEIDVIESNLSVWDLRGYAAPLSNNGDSLMTDMIINALKRESMEGRDYSLIILDPFYKLLDGDENSAEVIGRFCRELDKIVNDCEGSVIYTHHHAKGEQGGKSAMDRASGSGVFARDADMLIDVSELHVTEGCREMNPDSLSDRPCFRCSFVVRDFKNVDDIDVIFDCPVHVVDYRGVLADMRLYSPQMHGGKSSGAARAERRDEKIDELKAALKRGLDSNGNKAIPFHDAFASVAGDMSAKTERRYREEVEQDGMFTVFKQGNAYFVALS